MVLSSLWTQNGGEVCENLYNNFKWNRVWRQMCQGWQCRVPAECTTLAQLPELSAVSPGDLDLILIHWESHLFELEDRATETAIQVILRYTQKTSLCTSKINLINLNGSGSQGRERIIPCRIILKLPCAFSHKEPSCRSWVCSGELKNDCVYTKDRSKDSCFHSQTTFFL